MGWLAQPCADAEQERGSTALLCLRLGCCATAFPLSSQPCCQALCWGTASCGPLKQNAGWPGRWFFLLVFFLCLLFVCSGELRFVLGLLQGVGAHSHQGSYRKVSRGL